MEIRLLPTRAAMSQAAARHAAAVLRRAIAERGAARVVAATAASQVEFQRALVNEAGIDWSKVEVFQLDEYVGLPTAHPASFRQMLHAHLVGPAGITAARTIDAGEPGEAAAAMGRAIAGQPVDVAFLGIGENGHLAFNDPPADFDTTTPYLVVTLDEACRRQQVGEGWFPALEDVPQRAVTMSIRQMLSAREVIVIVPDERKAAAVEATVEGPITPDVPASILRTHPHATLYLDEAAAARLSTAARAATRHAGTT
jgi:glucosamine-6-phosphate deaminase